MKKKSLTIEERTAEVEKVNSSLIPIVIGVSAHRNIRLKCKEQIKDEVKKALLLVHQKSPSSPIVLLNGLASGGDQWCAEAAMELKTEQSLDLRLTAVLPCAESEYLNDEDFTQEEKENYLRIKDYFGAEVFVSDDIEKLSALRKTELNMSERDYNFRQQAIFVATKCHILLALWNGEEVSASELHTACGTSATVDFALNHSYYRHSGSEFDFNYDGLVFTITSPREGNALDENKTVQSYYLTSANNSLNSQVENSCSGDDDCEQKARYKVHSVLPEQMETVLLKTERFNTDAKKLAQKIENNKTTLGSYALIGDEEYASAGKVSKKLHDCHSVASRLSVLDKNGWLKNIRILSILGGLLLIAFMFYDNLPWKEGAAIVSLSLFGIIALTYLFMRKGSGGKTAVSFDAHDRFVEYRALAEALRVQYYINENGVRYDIGSSFTWSQKTGVSWVRKAVTALSIGEKECCWQNSDYQSQVSSFAPAIVKYEAPDAQAVLEDRLTVAWIGRFTKNEKSGGWDLNKNGQVGYHLKKHAVNAREIAKNEKISSACMIITLLAYLALFVGTLIISGGWDGIIINSVFSVGTIIKLALSSVAVLTFFISYYYDKLALDQTLAENESMIHFYRIALDWVERIFSESSPYKTDEQKRTALRSLVIELAHEEIHENGNWIAYNRNNDINLPL